MCDPSFTSEELINIVLFYESGMKLLIKKSLKVASFEWSALAYGAKPESS